MTRDEAKEMLPIIKAFSEGKEIEGIYKGLKTPWFKVEDLVFDEGIIFRIKSESKYRPFANAEECLKEMQKHTPFGLIKKNFNGTFYCIGSFDIKNIYIGATQSIRSYADSLEKFTFVDDTPFGVKVEE